MDIDNATEVSISINASDAIKSSGDEPTTNEKLLTSADEQNLNYPVADDAAAAVSDEPSTPNIDVVIANETYEEQQHHQQQSAEAEIFECIEVVGNGTIVLYFLMLHFQR